jgi:hypothetical protein
LRKGTHECHLPARDDEGLEAIGPQNSEQLELGLVDALRMTGSAGGVWRSRKGCSRSEELEQLDDLRAALEEYRQGGLTDKNLALIRQVLSGPVWREVVGLPDQLMAEARRLKEQAPLRAALRAQLAVAIGILTVAPVRVGNLVRIRLEENLIRPTGPNGPYWLVFPHYDVKNRLKLEFVLDAHLTALIAEYAHEHRPVLLRGLE